MTTIWASACRKKGTGIIGSSAYAAGEAFGWHVGLARKFAHAKAFYAAIAGTG